jgi:hypothetical protein
MPVTQTVDELIRRGVRIICPESVEVDETVSPDRVAAGSILYPGTRIRGAATSIGPGCRIGEEAPATVENCNLGRNVELKGGTFSGAVFLDKAGMGSSAHVRPGTLLEEEASGGHAVGFKQTIFLSFTTAGSLINFCDALMAGGTSRRDHSEIGSSYIHFNFTPHQDKATASLIGDVPRGVMLDQPPIFLGGQGGLVGPVRIEYGTVIPAGVICRRDVLEPNQLYNPPSVRGGRARPFLVGAYRTVRRIVLNNLVYIGNLLALKLWYQHVRKLTMGGDMFAEFCRQGALTLIDGALDERIKRLGDLAGRMERSIELSRTDGAPALTPEQEADQKVFMAAWPGIAEHIRKGPSDEAGAADRDRFLETLEKSALSPDHTRAIGMWDQETKKAGSAWLQAVVDETAAAWKSDSR